jgi:hypothetical protein
MKRSVVILVVLLVALASVAAFAGHTTKVTQASEKSTATTSKPMTVSGEIVDMGCYLSQGAKGPDHKSCGSMCLSSGMPMGLLTKEGKLYLLTLNHDKADPYNNAKKLADEWVTITGTVSERNGIKSLTVDELTQASTGMNNSSTMTGDKAQ